MDRVYAEIESWSDPGSSKGGAVMRALIKGINEALPSTHIWGLTSHERLLLHASPECAAPWFVSIVAYGDQIIIEYKLPPEIAPWKDAVVRGIASDVQTALSSVKTSMVKSGGWPLSDELATNGPESPQ